MKLHNRTDTYIYVPVLVMHFVPEPAIALVPLEVPKIWKGLLKENSLFLNLSKNLEGQVTPWPPFSEALSSTATLQQ